MDFWRGRAVSPSEGISVVRRVVPRRDWTKVQRWALALYALDGFLTWSRCIAERGDFGRSPGGSKAFEIWRIYASRAFSGRLAWHWPARPSSRLAFGIFHLASLFSREDREEREVWILGALRALGGIFFSLISNLIDQTKIIDRFFFFSNFDKWLYLNVLRHFFAFWFDFQNKKGWKWKLVKLFFRFFHSACWRFGRQWPARSARRLASVNFGAPSARGVFWPRIATNWHELSAPLVCEHREGVTLCSGDVAPLGLGLGTLDYLDVGQWRGCLNRAFARL
jgi:hypothetical protein